MSDFKELVKNLYTSKNRELTPEKFDYIQKTYSNGQEQDFVKNFYATIGEDLTEDKLAYISDTYLKKNGSSIYSATPSQLPKISEQVSPLQQGANILGGGVFKEISKGIPQLLKEGTQTTVNQRSPKEEKGWLINTVSALDKGFYKNMIGSPVKGLGTLLQQGTAKITGGTGEGFVSDALIKFGDYFNNAIDELTPQDESYKNSLSDQFGQALGQVASLVMTGGVGGTSKGASAIGQAVPKAATTASALKSVGSGLASPVAISSGLTMGQAEFDRAKQAGATDEQAFEAFYKNAAVGSILEKIPVMQFMKRFNQSTGGGVANYIKTKGVAGITGGLEEMTTEVLQQLYANKTAKDIYNTNQDLFEGITQSGGIGFGVGFLLNAMGANVKLLKKQGKQNEAKLIENQIKQFEQKSENATTANDAISTKIAVNGNEEGLQRTQVELDRDLQNGVISDEQYKEKTAVAQRAAEVNAKIPDYVQGVNRAESIDLINEREALQQELMQKEEQKKSIDVAYHKSIDESNKEVQKRIDEINNQLGELAKPEKNIIKPNVRTESLEYGGSKYYITDNSGNEVGSAEVSTVDDKIIIDNLFVDEKNKRKGLATSILDKIIEDFKGRNYEYIDQNDVEFSIPYKIEVGTVVSEEGQAFSNSVRKKIEEFNKNQEKGVLPKEEVIVEEEIQQPIELSPELPEGYEIPNQPIEEQGEVAEAVRVEQEPEAKEGVKVVTLSGMVEGDRVKAVEERKKKTTLTEKETLHNDLIDLASRADKARGNEKTNLQGKIRQRVRELNAKLGEEVYKYDGVSVRVKVKSKTKGERYLKIKGTTRDTSGRAIKEDAVLLFDRSPEFVQKYEQLADSPNITALQVDSGNGVTMTAKQIESALQDIADGIPSVQADNLLNALEEGFNRGYFDLRGKDIGQDRVQASVEDFIGVQQEEVGQPMDEDEVINWLNEIQELPQEEQIEIDNIILEYEQQPQQIDISGKVQSPNAPSKTTSPTSPKPSEEGKGNGSPKEKVGGEPIAEAKPKETKSLIQKIKDYATDVITNRKEISRLHREAEQGRKRGGSRNVEATILLSTSDGKPKTIEGSEQQERVIEDYAKQEGIWYENIEEEPSYGKEERGIGVFANSGVESQVYIPKDNPKIVRKVMRIKDPFNEGSKTPILDFLDNKISLHNSFAESVPYTVIGFGRLDNGDFVVISEQPNIQNARNATPQEISQELINMGYEDKGRGSFESPNLSISDARPKNVLVDESGKIHFIDVIIEPKYEPNQDWVESLISDNKQQEPKTPPPTPPKEEGKGEEGDANLVALEHAATEAKREAYGMEGRTLREVKTDEKLDAEANQAIKDGYDVKGLIKRVIDKDHLPTDKEHIILLKYAAGLESKLQKLDLNSKEFEETFNELNATYKASEVGGSELGAAFRARQSRVLKEDSLGEMLVREAEVNRVEELTPEQRANVVKEYEAMKKAKEAWEAKYNELQNKQLQKDAEAEVQKAKRSSSGKKKTKEDFSKERQSIKDAIKDKWKKAANDGTLMAIPVPYGKQLAAISPDVAKLMKSYVEEGITDLGQIVGKIKEDVQDFVEGITEKDIRDIIAGVYNEKRTKSQIAADLRDLRDEAKLVNKLELLENGEIPKTEKAKVERNQKITDLRNRIKELKKEMIGNATIDGEPVNKKLKSIKTRLEKQIQELEEKLNKGDYSKEEKKPPIKLDKEAQELKDKLIKLKQEREIRLLQQEYANRTKTQKLKDLGIEVLNIPRTIMASIDFSAPLRQGIIATIAHPKIASSAFVEMFRQAVSQKRFDRWFYDLRESPEYEVMEKAGLYISDPHDPKLSAKEEQFMNNLAEKIPFVGRLIKGSERAYIAYLNKMRADLFLKGAEAFETEGKTIANSKKLYEDLASFINNATGRGKMANVLEDSAPILNAAFFSPRLMASRINLMNPSYYYKLSPEVGKMAMNDMAKYLAFSASLLALAALAGAEVEKDPRSKNFMKIKIGDTTYDILGGFQQYMVELTRLLRGETKSATTGEIRSLSGKEFPFKTRGDELQGFVRGKLAPIPASTMNLLTGKKVTGERTDLQKEFTSLVLPLNAKDAYDAFKKQGLVGGLSTLIPATFGVGVQTMSNIPEGADMRKPEWKFISEKRVSIPKPDLETLIVDESGREMTLDEVEKFVELRTKKLEKFISGIIKNGMYVSENGKPPVLLKSKDIPKDALDDIIKKASIAATKDVKEEMFGKEKKSEDRMKKLADKLNKLLINK